MVLTKPILLYPWIAIKFIYFFILLEYTKFMSSWVLGSMLFLRPSEIDINLAY